MMAVVQVTPAHDGVVDDNFSWSLAPVLIPMRWMGLQFGSSPNSRWITFYRFFWLILNISLQLFACVYNTNGSVERFYSQIHTTDFTWILKLDNLSYCLINVAIHMIVLFDVAKKWSPLTDTYKRIESSYNFNLYPMGRKLSFIGIGYCAIMVSW